MNSIDAECLLYSLTTGNDAEPPDQWQHLDGGTTLAFRFGESENTYTWPAEIVEEMAERWRSEGGTIPDQLRDMADSHKAFAALIEKAEMRAPDRIVHDLRTWEMTAIWDEEKLVVVIDGDLDPATVGS